MGRKAKYCIFHSLEGSGNQNRNNERCGVDNDGEVKVNKKGEVAKLTCPAFVIYGPVTKQQRKELSELQRMAAALSLRKEFTLRKIMEIHAKHNWDWSAANGFIKDLLLSYQVRSFTGSNLVVPTEDTISPTDPSDFLALTSTNGSISPPPILTLSTITNDEPNLSSACSVQLSHIVKVLGTQFSFWFLSNDLSNFNYLLECAARTNSIPHFQQAMRLLHANIKPTIWKDKETSIQWLSNVKYLDNVTSVADHIQSLIHNMECEHEQGHSIKELEYNTCCSPGSICCSFSVGRHNFSATITMQEKTLEAEVSVMCVCHGMEKITPNTFCFCKMMWIN